MRVFHQIAAGMMAVAIAAGVGLCAPKATSSESSSIDSMDAKPVIYLYPVQAERVRVQLDLNGTLTAAYPA